jgi:hypothetical protein
MGERMKNPVPAFESSHEDYDHLMAVVRAVQGLTPKNIHPADATALLRWITVQVTEDRETGELVEEAVGPWMEEASEKWGNIHQRNEDDEETQDNEEEDFDLEEDDDFGPNDDDDDDYMEPGDEED